MGVDRGNRVALEGVAVLHRERACGGELDGDVIGIGHWLVPGYTCRMNRVEEWDWPPRRRWRRYPSRFDVYQPSGWNSPITKKIIDIYWRVMITIIKVLLAIYLTIIAFGASWLITTVLTL
jgi:hypothetical protein